MSNEVSTQLNEQQLFELSQRQANVLSKSDLVPASYKGNIANCLLALNMAHRMNCDPMMVMQNVHIIQGRPTLSAQFLIAAFNATKRFSTIKYDFVGVEGQDTWGCRASAIERETGEKHTGTLVTIAMAKADGWYNKNKKWQAMSEHMMRFRAATFFIRQTCPEIALGFHTDEEVKDTQAKKPTVISVNDLLAKDDDDKSVIEGEVFFGT